MIHVGALESFNSAGDKGSQLSFINACTRARHDKCVNSLPNYFVGNSGCQCPSNGRVLEQDMVKLERRDFCTATHNEILDPAGKLDLTVLTHLCEISGSKESVDEGGAGKVRFVKVAVHDKGRANLQLANMLHWQFTTLIVGDTKLHSRSRTTDSSDERRLILLPKEKVRTACFSQSIYIDNAIASEHL